MASLIDGPVVTVPRIPRRRRRSRWPLLLQLIGFRIRLRLTLLRHQTGRNLELLWILIGLAWLWLKLQCLRLLRRLLDKVLPPRK